MIKIAIDAGHGLYTAGKRCMKSLDSKETREWILNSRIAEKLDDLLDDYECEVLRTDDMDGSDDISLANRCKAANNWKADIFISIHHNAGVNGSASGGTVLYYYSSKAERKQQCKDLYDAIVAETKLVGNRCDKVIHYPFYVIKNTNMPSFLIENGFMDSKVDVPIILTEAHATKTARGILNFLVKELNLKKKKVASTNNTQKKYYRCQCGVFSVKGNAESLCKRLIAAGFSAIINNVNNKYVVQVGAYGVKANATKMVEKVKAKGFDAFVVYR